MTKGQLAFRALEQWCRAKGYPVPVPEYPFALSVGRKFRFDAAWPGLAVPIGLDIQGSIWKKGGHNTGGGMSKDCEKFCIAATLGWRVMPCTYPQFNGGQVYGWLDAIFGAESAVI